MNGFCKLPAYPKTTQMPTANKSRKKVYALLVGIDKYEGEVWLNDEVSFPPLSGCVPDTRKMKSYLESDPMLDVEIVMILNSEATKAEVIRLFKEHLGKAKAGEVAFFFFSGHGTQEWADVETWVNEADNKLECFVCYYENDAEQFLMADKELRFLIQEVSKNDPHIVCVFDCCHSADNTRSGTPVATSFPDMVEKRLPYVFPKRKWQNFVFGGAITREIIQKKGERSALPEGSHIQLSACESDETALEVSGSGVFTKALFKVLKSSGGSVSYQELNSMVRQYLKNIFDQKPRLYVSDKDQKTGTLMFLDRSEIKNESSFGDLVHNDEKGWKFTLGGIHGVNEGAKVIITDPAKAGSSWEGTVKKSEIDSSFVDTEAALTKSTVYKAAVEGILLRKVKLFVNNYEQQNLAELQELMDHLFDDAATYLLFTDDESEADYTLNIADHKYFITKPFDHYRPLIKPLVVSRSATKKLSSYLKHISKWEFIRTLTNQSTAGNLPQQVVSIEMTTDDSTDSLLDSDDVARIHLKKENKQWLSRVKLKVTNVSTVNVYVGVIYLGSDFSADVTLLNPPVHLLEPGNFVFVSDESGNGIQFNRSDVMHYYNSPEDIRHFTFITSTDVFDLNVLQLPALPLPALPVEEQNERGIKDITRGIKLRKPKGWSTRSITLIIENPDPGGLSNADKAAMVNDPQTAWFAKSIYQKTNGQSKGGIFKSAPFDNPKMSRGLPEDNSGFTRSKPPSSPDQFDNMMENMPADFAMEESSGSAPEEDAAAPIDEPVSRSVSFPPQSSPPIPVATPVEIPPAAPAPAGSAPAASSPQPQSIPAPKKSREGNVEYDIPGQMQTGKVYNCKVNIAGKEVDVSEIKISETSVRTAIRVTDEMSVQLIDPSGGEMFKVATTSTERQGIFDGEKTTWNFTVRPLRGGNHPLVLKITIHMDGRNKDLDVLEKEIVVTATEDPGVATVAASPAVTRILFISANPLDSAPLRIGAETRQIREEIGLASARDKFAFTINLAVTTRTLSRAILQEDPSIVHFSGHGEEEGLCLETDSGVTKLVDDKALGFLFSNFANSIRCVILNACYSEKQAKAIAQHIPFVIGMNKDVKDNASLAFSVGFYQALADGSDIEGSYNMGIAAVALAVPGEENIPILVKKK